jgi:hypothetical protein
MFVNQTEDPSVIERVKMYSDLNSNKLQYCKEQIVGKGEVFDSLQSLLEKYPEWKN